MKHIISWIWPVWKKIRPIQWAWQRLFRGWDDRAIWSIDYWLARHLSEMLPKLAKDAHGWPAIPLFDDKTGNYLGTDPGFTFKDWQNELLEAASKFKHIANDDFLTVEEENKVNQDAFDWLAKRAGALWD